VDTATLHAVITDFGLARIMSQTTSIGTRTRTMKAGSPGFQPPEQLRSESVGPHCDVYAFGGVMAITMTERVLWPGLNAFQIMRKVTVENQKPNTEGMSGDIKSVCNMCFCEVRERPMITVILKSLLRVISGSQ
jgi:serine/threonine protein kinase